MGKYYLVRVWELKVGCRGEELEALMSSGYLEMQRWIPGVERVSLLRAGGEAEGRYVLTATFASYEAYRYWRQEEEAAADYWERYAAIAMQQERMCSLRAEYAGEVVVDTHVEGAI